MTPVEGNVEPGFERVREAFGGNVEHGGDVGAALCVYQRGRKVADLWGELDLDRPAASYWPEFAAEGKADIPVRWLLSHRAGLPVIDHPVPLADLLAWDPMAAALAAQRPAWEPGTAHGYHGRTYGWLVGEVIRRVSGRSVGAFFAEEIAGRPGSISSSGCQRPNEGGSARWSSTTRRAPRPSPPSRSSRFPSSSARCWPRSPIPGR